MTLENFSGKKACSSTRAGYYKGCAFLILVNYQFSVKYGGTVHCSKNSLIWYFRPCPLSSARSGGSVQREREGSQVNETYIFEILIQNAVDWWVLDPSNLKKIFGPTFRIVPLFFHLVTVKKRPTAFPWKFLIHCRKSAEHVLPLKMTGRGCSTCWWVQKWW